MKSYILEFKKDGKLNPLKGLRALDPTFIIIVDIQKKLNDETTAIIEVIPKDDSQEHYLNNYLKCHKDKLNVQVFADEEEKNKTYDYREAKRLRIKLKELLGYHREIKIAVKEQDLELFLRYAKEEGFLWSSGEIIKPTVDKPSRRIEDVVVDNEDCISVPGNIMRMMSLQKAARFDFADIKDEADIYEVIEKSKQVKKKDEEFMKMEELKRAEYQKKCETNRRLNAIQLKYYDKAQTLPKHFFVKYQNYHELFNLYELLLGHGYENIYDIDLVDYDRGPMVIGVNNQEMSFKPADLFHLDIATKVFHRIYEYEMFREMLIDIYGE